MIASPTVSVIIPTFNRAKFVCKAIDSVLAQTFSDYEIIVVNDGSIDDTQSVLSSYGQKIKLFSQDNQGLTATRNFAIDQAQGRYIAFLDDDDWWIPNKLAKQVQFLNEHPEIALVCSETYVVNENDQIVDHFKMVQKQLTFESLFDRNFIPLLTVLIRKNVFDDIGVFDPHVTGCDDYDLWLRVAKRYKYFYLNEPLAYYKLHANNLSQDLNLMLQKEKKVLEKPIITNGIPFVKKQIRLAKLFYEYAQRFEKKQQYQQAGRCYWQSVMYYPFVGKLFWPDLRAQQKWSFPYRLVYPYRKGISYLLKRPESLCPKDPIKKPTTTLKLSLYA